MLRDLETSSGIVSYSSIQLHSTLHSFLQTVKNVGGPPKDISGKERCKRAYVCVCGQERGTMKRMLATSLVLMNFWGLLSFEGSCCSWTVSLAAGLYELSPIFFVSVLVTGAFGAGGTAAAVLLHVAAPAV